MLSSIRGRVGISCHHILRITDIGKEFFVIWFWLSYQCYFLCGGTPKELNNSFNILLENRPPGVLLNAPKIESVFPVYSFRGLELNRYFMSILNSPIPLIYGEWKQANVELSHKIFMPQCRSIPIPEMW